MSLTTIRSGLQSYLQSNLGVRMVAGIITGPVEDEDRGCVWVTGGSRTDDAQSEIVTLHVRLLRRFSPDTPELRDPAQLEQDVDSVLAALKPIQTQEAAAAAGLTDAWFFNVAEWESDLETNGTEYVISCYRSDPFALGG